MQKNIIGFEVPVHDMVLRQNLKGLQQLSEVLEGQLERHYLALLAFAALDDLAQRAPVAVLVDEVVVIGGLEHVKITHDVRGLLDARKSVDFVYGALLQLWNFLKLLRPYHFDGHLLPSNHVEPFENFAVAAFPDELL